MKKEEIFEDLLRAIVDMDEEGGKRAAAKLIEEKIDLIEGIEKGLSQGMKIIGEMFNKSEIYLPEMIMAADVFDSTMGILKPHISAEALDKMKQGTVVIGTVKGDIHAIGKNIVAMLLETAGFTVHNLGVDIPASKFVDEIKETGARVVGLSGFLTLAFDSMKATVEAIEASGLRDGVKIMIGGGQVDDDIKRYIRADAYGKDAMAAVTLAQQWLGVD